MKTLLVDNEVVTLEKQAPSSSKDTYTYGLSNFMPHSNTTVTDRLANPTEIAELNESMLSKNLFGILNFKRLLNINNVEYNKLHLAPDTFYPDKYQKVFDYGTIATPYIYVPSFVFKKISSKRCFDVLFSLGVMLAGLPVFLLLMLVTKLTSKGPVFYKQERMGKHLAPFTIRKFRSMCVNSEAFGPCLSSENDPRITPWGRILRKTRLDELPQFWNVLKGEMSIVGPRPERKFFIDQLVVRSPRYKNLFSIKPGITSIGQVYYGYAENVDEMCKRIRYDLLYLNNVSFKCDMKVILKTVQVMAQRKGK